jgi:hypothetical protein
MPRLGWCCVVPLTRLFCLPLHTAAPLVAPAYTTQSTNVTFQLLTDLSDARTAELSCLQRGGHLATYASQAEQTEVEQYYIKAGYIIPTFHQFYWLSLSSNYMDYPDFSWWGRARARKCLCCADAMGDQSTMACPASATARLHPPLALAQARQVRVHQLPALGPVHGGHNHPAGAQRVRELRRRQLHAELWQGGRLGRHQLRLGVHLHLQVPRCA